MDDMFSKLIEQNSKLVLLKKKLAIIIGSPIYMKESNFIREKNT